MAKLIVKDTEIRVLVKNEIDFICITDMTLPLRKAVA